MKAGFKTFITYDKSTASVQGIRFKSDQGLQITIVFNMSKVSYEHDTFNVYIASIVSIVSEVYKFTNVYNMSKLYKVQKDP